jgi:hypothetical protein
MARTLTFLHTSPGHIATFDALLAETGEEVSARHIVRESLLREARARGITPQLQRRVAETVLAAFEGAGGVLVCTCSTIGACAEATGNQHSRPVIRLDRPMAERAVELGSRILVVGTLAPAIASTHELVLEVARRAGKKIAVTELMCGAAWKRYEEGDQAGYLQLVADAVCEAAAEVDVVVLAQASIADAADLCAEVSTPILSSPRLGVEAALAALEHAEQAA